MSGGGPEDYFLDGNWDLRCQECYIKIKSGDARRRWDNLLVCWRCWEIRNPQDFVRGIPDDSSVPYSTGNPKPIYIGPFTEQPNYRLINSASPQSGGASGQYVYNGLIGSITIG